MVACLAALVCGQRPIAPRASLARLATPARAVCEERVTQALSLTAVRLRARPAPQAALDRTGRALIVEVALSRTRI